MFMTKPAKALQLVWARLCLHPAQSATLCALTALALCATPAGAAATFRVDDSGTTISTPLAAMRWRALVPGRGADNTAEGQVQVNLRLNLQQWVNRPVRLYMALAPTPLTTALRATWRTQGKLLAGTVLSGQRSLIFEGSVAGGILLETLQLQLAADGRELTAPQSLQFSFEVEPL